jgi:DNA-binding transcriptional regulator YhcF (GntR family)
MPQTPQRDPLPLFAIDRRSATPPFRQVHDTVVEAVKDGSLLPGQKLPTVRALAAHLGLAVNTIAGAYRALEEAGLVEGRGRAGTFVRLGDDPVRAQARRIALEAVDAFRKLGVDRDRGLELVGEAFEAG